MNATNMETRAARVSLVTGISTVLAVVMQLVSVPLCMKYWGQGEYGLWLTLSATFLFVRSLDGGYVAYVGNKVNYLYHVDRRALQLHLSSAVLATCITGSLQLLFAFAVAFSGPVARLVGMSDLIGADGSATLGLVVLLVSWVLTGSYLGVVHRLLVPAGMMYQAAWWGIVFQVAQFLAILCAALASLNMLQTSALYALAQSSAYLASAVYIRHKLPEFYPWWRGARARVGLRDLVHSGALTLSGMVQQATTNGLVLLVAAVSGPLAVPVFTTVRTLANLWTTLSNTLTAPLLPETIRFHATRESAKLRVTVEAHWVVVGSAVNASVLLAYPLLPSLYSFWTRGLPLNDLLLALLLGAVVIANLGGLISLHLNGINSLRIVLGTSVLRCLVTLGVGAVAYPAIGVAAFGLGVLASEVLVLAIISVFFRLVLRTQGSSGDGLPIGPALLGAASVELVLIGHSTGWAPLSLLVPAAACGVVISMVWGWRRLPAEVRGRLARLARFPDRSASRATVANPE